MEADVILFKGRLTALHSSPLESFWSEARPRPSFEFPDVFPRGYVAIWGVPEGMLYLIQLDGWVTHHGALTHLSAVLFPEVNTPGGEVFADWYSGSLRIPQRDRIESHEDGLALVYEREFDLSVNRGVIVDTRLLQSGPSRRSVDSATVALEEARASRVVDGWLLCPHCGRRFAIRDPLRWDGERHITCEGRIALL